MTEPARCIFYARTPGATPGSFAYSRISLHNWHGDGYLYTPHPPAPGDLVGLVDADGGPKGVFRVLERDWTHPEYGSRDWPIGSKDPAKGPLVTIVVEPSAGMFRDEATQADS